MAPSGEHRPEELGRAQVHAAAVATSNSAIALRKQVTDLNRHASGKTVTEQCELLTKQAGIAEKTARNLGIVAEALKIREDAARAWNKDAPKDSQIKAAEEAVTAAKKALMDASTASGDTSAASTKLEAAQKKLGELRRKRREADEAYDDAEKKAAEKLKEITTTGSGTEQDSPGRDVPGSGTGADTGSGNGTPSTGSPRPSGENGKRADPSKTTTGGTPKPSTTTTPSAGKPSSTETKSGDDLSSLLTQLASQQQPQSQQGQGQQAQPAASTPQQATPQQPEKEKDKPEGKQNPLEKLLGADGVLDVKDLPGLGVALGGGIPTPTTSTPAASVTPSAPAPAAPATTGLSASATTNAQPVTTGNSAAGLHTSSDVTGRSGEARTAFSVGPETKTSGASGGGTNAAPANATGTRPGGAGMPMVPMGGMGAPGGGGGRSKDRDQAQTTAAAGNPESDALHGRHTVAEAVPGGTIAQRDHPRHRGEDAA